MISFKGKEDKSHKYSSAPPIENAVEEYENMSEIDQQKAIQNPGHVDEAKWSEAKKISEKSYGEHRWPFVMYMYEKLGGKK